MNERDIMEIQLQTPQDVVLPSPPPPAKETPSHVCSYCQASFRRDEHLQRHIRTHTGEKKYRCPCKMTFARNDVFVRHIRICQPNLSDEFTCSASKSRSRTKTKRACDECASAKAKCDYQSPCERCHRKSLKCGKTRRGYEDPYANYSIVTPATTPPVITEIQSEKDNDQTMSNSDGLVVDPALQTSESMCLAEHETSMMQELNVDRSSMILVLPPSPQTVQMDDASDIFSGHSGMMTEYDFTGNGCALTLDPDPVSLHLASMGNLDLLLNPQTQYDNGPGYDFFSFQQITAPLLGTGFSMTRLDPLEAKCHDMIELLKQASPRDKDQIIYSYINRHNLVHLCHLYGKHFQQNMSIIHSPTFEILNTPPTLLLAVMLVGACYSTDTIPSSQVTKLAMKLLTAIGLEPYETDMSCPSVSLIQAGVLVCCILSCSTDTAALRSVRISVARNISMCERAGLLEPIEPVDYMLLTEDTFDWDLWIQQESRKRLACEIFCQDMVHCIFLGRTPDFEPRQFHVELPTYEVCWEAETASECLRLLQSLPQAMRVSTAMTLLISWPESDAPLFEASGFGMFVLINGMHFLLHQATQADKETSAYLPYVPDPDTANAIKRLKHDPSGPNITAIADRALKMHASPVIRRVDNALNAWRTTWDLRSNRDSKHEHCTFKGDPLPFWWLAKLYLLLHYHAHVLQPDSEFATSRAGAPDDCGKSMIQRKIVGWLSSFRGRKFQLNSQTEIWLPEMMKLTHEDTP